MDNVYICSLGYDEAPAAFPTLQDACQRAIRHAIDSNGIARVSSKGEDIITFFVSDNDGKLHFNGVTSLATCEAASCLDVLA